MPTPRETALADHPDFPFLDPADTPTIEKLMHRVGFLHTDERVIAVAKAGAGNMNLVLRVTTDRRSVILKQARPWVEKYDMIAAPWDRAVSERRFYERVRGVEGLADRMPTLLGHDDATRTLLLEDLGAAADLSSVYADGSMTRTELTAAAEFLRNLHNHTTGERGGDFLNTEMRKLNHAHIYDIPLSDHGLVDLDAIEPGLAATTAKVRADAAFAAKVRATGELYLAAPGDDAVLLHGDFFPGSLLRTPGGLRVIDPEFCFAGSAEFDAAVMTAHLVLADDADDVRHFLNAYDAGDLDLTLLARITGCEVMRRLIGVAQLPIPKTTGRRADLLDRARRAVVDEDLQPLLT